MTNDQIVRFLAAAQYERDDREPPDPRRRGRFKAGWEDATLRNEVYESQSLLRLTWQNLGFRFGRAFGPQPETAINEVYELLASLFDSTDAVRPVRLAEELDDRQPVVEGAAYQITVNAYERNPEVRRRCIVRHGTNCYVCGVNFGQRYGLVAEGFIHVHHLRPLSERAAPHSVDPEKDLIPVCPNCHAVIHRRTPPFSIEEVRAFLAGRRQDSR